jgi:Ion transport protein
MVTPCQTTPLVSRSNNWKRGTDLRDKGMVEEKPAEEEEEEKRQDSDSLLSVETRRISPRSSPLAVLKLRRTNLFSSNEGPSNPITVTYSPHDRDQQVSSRSLAASMFLVSPLRPLARQRISFPSSTGKTKLNNSGLKAALIDSSESVLRPLTPRKNMHKPKRSLSAPFILDDNEESKDDQQTNSFLMPPSLQQRKTQQQQQQTSSTKSKQQLLIPAEHPYKILWDVLTFILSFANVYATHTSIRDRQFGNSWFTTFCEAWFVADILLNFFTEYRSNNYALRDCRSVWARYLTTWFVIDVLSLFPGEVVYLKPIIDQQNRRNWFTKGFFRTKAVVRVTRILRGRHFKLFGKVARHSKHSAGVGAVRLLRCMIKYIPKYWLFFRNMKGVLAIRMLRQIHWFRKVWRNFIARGLMADDANSEMQPSNETPRSLRKLRREYDDDEDGGPF